MCDIPGCSYQGYGNCTFKMIPHPFSRSLKCWYCDKLTVLLMDLLNRFFRTLTFKYVEEKQGYAVYGVAIASMIGGDKQMYVLAFVPVHLGVLQTCGLSDLSWVNLQMRTCLKSTYPTLQPQDWVFPIKINNFDIVTTKRTKTYTSYRARDPAVTFPFELLLLHSSKKRTIYQFPESGNLHWAINKFNTVINYIAPQPLQTPAPVYVHHTPYPTPPSASNPLQGWVQNTSGDSDYDLL